MELMSQDFDEFEKNPKEKEAITSILQCEIGFLKVRIYIFEKNTDGGRQYFRTNFFVSA